MNASSPRPSLSTESVLSEQRRSASQQPNEKLALVVKDFSLVNRLLNVRIYQVFHTSAGDCIGFRVAATDEVENDYALLISRAKGEQLYHEVSVNPSEPPSPEAIASAILAHLDIVGNRHRDVGRLICRDPEIHVDHKTRVVPPRPRSSSKQRNAQAKDKRASRNKQSQQRAMDAIAAAHSQPLEGDVVEEPVAADGTNTARDFHSHSLFDSMAIQTDHKSRRSSEASLLHRMAYAPAATVWRAELEGIDDDLVEQSEDDEETEAADVPPLALHESTVEPPVPQYKRALPERKPKYSELQQRRDKERKQRLQLVRPVVVRTPPSSAEMPKQSSSRRLTTTTTSSPPRGGHRPSAATSSALVAASATIGNAFALKTIVGDSQYEEEKFLRRKTILENQNRVFKAESVFDDALGVEITLERPDRRFRTPEHAPQTPELPIPRRKPSKKPRSSVSAAKVAPSDKMLAKTVPSSHTATSTPLTVAPHALVQDPPQLALAMSQPLHIDGGVLHEQVSGLDKVSGEPVVAITESLPGESIARDEDAAIETISIADDVAIAPSANPVATAIDNLDPIAQHTVHYTPRSARGSGVISIHEDEPQEVVAPSEPIDVPHEAEGPSESLVPPIESSSEAIKSPRVECWEEVEQPRAELEHDETEPAETVGISVEPPDSVAEHWASPPKEATLDDHGHKEEMTQTLPTTAEEPRPLEEPPHASCTQEAVVRTQETVSSASALDHVEDPSVVLVSPRQTQESNHGSREIVTSARRSPVPLKRADTVSARRGSVMDAAASAIAMAAAAAVAAASTTPPGELPPSTSKSSPKNDAKRTGRKRQSQDASAGHTVEGRRDGPRRSTIHQFHSADRIRQPTGAAFTPIDKVNAATDATDTTDSPPPDLEAPDPKKETPSATVSAAEAAERKPLQSQNRQRSQQEIDAVQKSPTYHAKWHKWTNGKQLLDKVSCLQLEEHLLQDPTNATNLVKLGLRYARWPATSLPAVLLLENEAIVHDGISAHSHEYWNSVGNAHFDVFLRHRKFLPVAVFHLGKSQQAFTRAFAYLESVADPLLLLRYAICMYWKKSDNNTNLEHADDIMRELFAKFASFCDKDRPNLLFFHFQILCRLKMFTEAIETLNKVVAIHDATLTPASTADTEASSCAAGLQPYDSVDYLLMLMHCQQTSGDFLQASATFTQVLKRLHQQNSEILPDGSTLSDKTYLQMWGALADKCFGQEDYALAIDFYAIALTYAKDSRVLARVLYNHALCYQAIGEGIKCSAEFKRAKNTNRHVTPFATLAEIHARYDDEYIALLRTPVSRIIDDVRQNLYDRAVTSLQRIFRRKKKGESDSGTRDVDGLGSAPLQRSSSGGVRNGLDRRRQSVVASLTNLVEGNGKRKESGLGVGVPQGRRSAAMIDPHEAFLQRQAVALEKLEKIRGRQLRKTTSMRLTPTKLAVGTQSGLLSPVADRPDLRRKHSMDSLARRLGYLPENREQFGGYWEELVTTSLDLYETPTVFHRHVAQIRSVLPLVSEAVASCALADALGNVDSALERLHDTTYEQELQLASTVVDITTILQRHFDDTQERTRFPLIQSPAKTVSSPLSKPDPLSPQKQTSAVSLPAVSPQRASLKAVRLSSLIDAQFEDARQSQPVETSNEARLRDVDQFVVVDDFRAVNASLLHGWQR